MEEALQGGQGREAEGPQDMERCQPQIELEGYQSQRAASEQALPNAKCWIHQLEELQC